MRLIEAKQEEKDWERGRRGGVGERHQTGCKCAGKLRPHGSLAETRDGRLSLPSSPLPPRVLPALGRESLGMLLRRREACGRSAERSAHSSVMCVPSALGALLLRGVSSQGPELVRAWGSAWGDGGSH